MKWIGLTGGIGTGKSSVAQFLKEMNQATLDADKFTKKALLKGTTVYKKIVNYFGKEILASNQSIDKKKLGKKVFRNKNQLRQLEKMIHPYVQKQVLKEKKRLKSLGYPFCFYEIPLLFEKNLTSEFDDIILVYSRKALQKKRLLKNRNLSIKEIEDRLKNQIPIEKKMKISKGWTIKNEGTLLELKKKTKNLLEKLKKINAHQ